MAVPAQDHTIDVLLLDAEPWNIEIRRPVGGHRIEHLAPLMRITDEDVARVHAKHAIEDYFFPAARIEIDGAQVQTHGFQLPHLPHLGITVAASLAAGTGYRVRVIDNLCRSKAANERTDEALRAQPRIVCLTTTFLLTTREVNRYVKRIRTLAPDARIVLGGPTLRRLRELHGAADFAAFNAAENTLREVLEVIEGRRPASGVGDIAFVGDGGAVRYGELDTKFTPFGLVGRPYRQQKSAIASPDWRLVDRGRELVYPIEFSRGCQYGCTFCAHNRGKVIRPLDEIRAELLANAELGITRYRPVDSNFTDGPGADRTYPLEVCDVMIELDLGLEWSCYGRPDNITPELVERMAKAGCTAIFFGVESGDDDILELMRKGHDASIVKGAVKMAQAAGIDVHANVLVGYPGETEETFERTVALIEEARPDTTFFSTLVVQENSWLYAEERAAAERGAPLSRMETRVAYDLIDVASQRLLDQGLCLGNEFTHPLQTSYGLSLAESKDVLRKVNLLAQGGPEDRPGYQEALARCREVALECFPAALAKDQAAWRR